MAFSDGIGGSASAADVSIAMYGAGLERLAGGAHIAIGVFDGVHRGHRRVLREAYRASRDAGTISVALTFDRHPANLLAPSQAPGYLSSLSQRVEWLISLGGADLVAVARFDNAFASLAPHMFVREILLRRLFVRGVFVGADFRYGRDRHGTVMDLEADGDMHGFSVSIVHPDIANSERISSTRIREMVTTGDVGTAEELLGHPLTVRGHVVRGKQLGRTLGFPTANIDPEEPAQIIPAAGVYAGCARACGEEKWTRAAISIGANPTTDAEGSPVRVEAFLLDGFSADLYGATVDLAFHRRLRSEEKFASLDALVNQMTLDVAAVRRLISCHDE